MTDIPNKPTYTHGSTGTKPGTAINYNSGDPVNADEFDYFINTEFETLKQIIDFLLAIDSDEDGVVDEADNADKLDGYHYSDIQAWVNNNADVPDADYADEAGNLNGLTVSDIRPSLYEAGVLTLTSPSEINFTGDISVTDDGDGTATINMTTVDTRVGIDNNGSNVTSTPSRLNFTNNIVAEDPDDDSVVTISSDDDATSYKNNDIDTDGDGIVDKADETISFDARTSYPSNPDNGQVVFRTDKT